MKIEIANGESTLGKSREKGVRGGGFWISKQKPVLNKKWTYRKKDLKRECEAFEKAIGWGYVEYPIY